MLSPEVSSAEVLAERMALLQRTRMGNSSSIPEAREPRFATSGNMFFLLPKGAGKGPRRLTLLPIYGAAFEAITGDDKKWWDEQSANFARVGEGLATEPDFGLLVYEAINFMDGQRSTRDIAMLLSAEYLADIDQAWVDRLVTILEKHGLVTTK